MASTNRAGVYFQQLQQFDQKANPQPTGANTQIQKVAAPTDSAVVSDSSLITATIRTPPFKYGAAQYGQAQYGAMYKNVILADTPVAYYRMDERAFPEVLDWSGNGNNGTINGGVTLGQPGAIADGDTAMKFDGSTGYIQLPTSMTISGQFTVEVWANLSSAGAGPFGMLGSRGPTDYSFDLKLGNSSTINIVHSDIGTGSAWLSTAADASTTIFTGVWYHVVYVATSSGYTIYLTGVSIGSGSLIDTPLLCDSNHQLRIGSDGSAAPEFFNGFLDEVAIYAYALSADQVQRHYNAAMWK